MARTTSSHAVPLLPLPHGGRIPQIGLGTWLLRGGECERVVGRAFELGYRHVDTAEMYGNEEAIGRVVRSSGLGRAELFLISKAWYDHLRQDDLVRACEGSLERLGVDYLDLYLVHWPNRYVPIGETVSAFQRLQEDGRIRDWGVSNFTIRHLEKTLQHGTPSINQVEMHPRLRQSELDRYCSDHEILITAYSPLAHGEIVHEEVLQEIGRAHDKTAGQVALRWLLQRGHVVIPKSRCEEHLENNLDVLDFELTAEDIDRIDGLDRGERQVAPGFAEFDR